MSVTSTRGGSRRGFIAPPGVVAEVTADERFPAKWIARADSS